MEFKYTILYVPDVIKTIEFYEKAFGVERKFVDKTGQYGELATGSTTLSFASHELGKKHGFNVSLPDKVNFEIAFITKNIEEDFKKATYAGAEEVSVPQEMPWGQKVGYVKDINGFLVEIASPMK